MEAERDTARQERDIAIERRALKEIQSLTRERDEARAALEQIADETRKATTAPEMINKRVFQIVSNFPGARLTPQPVGESE